jgi:hypothetical protein
MEVPFALIARIFDLIPGLYSLSIASVRCFENVAMPHSRGGNELMYRIVGFFVEGIFFQRVFEKNIVGCNAKFKMQKLK